MFKDILLLIFSIFGIIVASVTFFEVNPIILEKWKKFESKNIFKFLKDEWPTIIYQFGECKKDEKVKYFYDYIVASFGRL